MLYTIQKLPAYTIEKILLVIVSWYSQTDGSVCNVALQCYLYITPECTNLIYFVS